MNKNFTKEDIIKKHQTNVKSAGSAYCLAGILGVVYIVRYFITGNFNFYFSLSFTDGVLKSIEGGSLSLAAGYTMIGLFVALYVAGVILVAVNPKHLVYTLIVYLSDFACLLGQIFLNLDTFKPDRLIDVIIHCFIIIFIAVGIHSEKYLRKERQS